MVLANTRGNDAEGLEVPAESLSSKNLALELILFINYKNVSYEKNKCYFDLFV